jgi:ribonucleoside-diphosphate reductase alpha chain
MVKKVDARVKKTQWQVVKVNGSMQAYDESKVADAIYLAAQDVGGTDRSLADAVATKVTEYLYVQFGRMKQISTRDVGDAVERILIQEQHVKTAKAYILNRDKKREEYEAKIRLGVKDDVGMSLNALTVMKNKYLQVKNQKSEITNQTEEEFETPREAFARVAKALAGAEKTKKLQLEWDGKFFRVMVSRRFLPGGRTLANAGTVNNQLANCFVMPFPDDIEGIFESVRDSSVLKKNGGGVGFSFSKIRPKGDRVATTSGEACGPVALMAILDHASDIFLQAGGRRSGNMVTLADTHPDIFEFITCKESGTNLPHINYSIEISDALMKAAAADDDWKLINPRNGEVTQVVSARSVLEQAARLAWKNGDPGMIFIDEINTYNPTPHVDRLNTVNLCGEQPLLSYEACNLGSINLGIHVIAKKGRESSVGDFEVDWKLLEESVRTGVRMLDNVVSVCTYPLIKVDEVVKSNRKIGLGVMGFADMLVKLGISYDSREGLKLAGRVMKFIQEKGWDESERLAKEKGSFPNFKGSIWEKRGYKRFRNATVTTIAPTGSLSMVAQCSGGIEPHFALAFFRKAWGNYELPEVNQDLVTALKRSNRVYSEDLMRHIAQKGSIQQVEGIPDKLKRVFVTAMDIAPEYHVRMQATFQKYTDNAVSKTINLPQDATVDDVMEAFVLAWETKCKGITVYRDKSREFQVLNVGDHEHSKLQVKSQNFWEQTKSKVGHSFVSRKHEEDVCPECGSTMAMVEGCATCNSCGYSHCSV